MYPAQPERIIHLNDLVKDFDISVRTYNVCRNYDLLELPRLLDFYLKTADFTLLQGAGKKTHQELEKICRHYLRQRDGDFEKPIVPQERLEERRQISIIDPVNLSAQQVNVMEAYVKQKFQELSVRSQNALSHFLNYRVSYATIHRFFFFEEVPVSRLRNVGSKTLTEIEAFFTGLKKYAAEVVTQQDDNLLADFLSRQLSLTLNLQPRFWEVFLPQMREKNFPLFAFLQKLILQNHLFKKNHNFIARRRFGWFKEEGEQSLDEIALTLGLTRERVRQIALSVAEDLPEKLNFLNTYKTQLLELSGDYGLDFSKDLVLVRQAVADDINLREQTSFTPKFFATAFSFLQTDTHLLFGEQFDFFQNHYLIRRELTGAFDFEAFIGDLRRQTSERIEEDYSLDLDGHLYSFLKTGETSQLARARRVCEDLLLLEFEEATRLDFPDSLVLCRNTKLRILNYILEALKHRGEPMHVTEVYTHIREQYPELEITEGSVRATLQREKFHFIYFGRTSTYGLAKWETEREGIRGGTIRDITEEYLQQFSEPKHYYDITVFVLRYRPDTSPKSIHANLQYDMSGRFREFTAGFWGLAERNYGDFQARRLSPHVFSYFKAWLIGHPDASAEDAVEYLSKRWQVQPVQSKAWLDEKLRSGTLRLENDKLVIAK